MGRSRGNDGRDCREESVNHQELRRTQIRQVQLSTVENQKRGHGKHGEWKNGPNEQLPFIQRIGRLNIPEAAIYVEPEASPKEQGGRQPAVCFAAASAQLDSRVPAPGTQLIKRYKDETLTVLVLEDGFQYRERVYKSLSAIARQVTGTQWNGYLFFGLGVRKEQSSDE